MIRLQLVYIYHLKLSRVRVDDKGVYLIGWDKKKKKKKKKKKNTEKQKVMKKFSCDFGDLFHWLALNVDQQRFVIKYLPCRNLKSKEALFLGVYPLNVYIRRVLQINKG